MDGFKMYVSFEERLYSLGFMGFRAGRLFFAINRSRAIECNTRLADDRNK